MASLADTAVEQKQVWQLNSHTTEVRGQSHAHFSKCEIIPWLHEETGNRNTKAFFLHLFFPIVSFSHFHFVLYLPIFLFITWSSFSNILLFFLHFLSFPFFFIWILITCLSIFFCYNLFSFPLPLPILFDRLSWSTINVLLDGNVGQDEIGWDQIWYFMTSTRPFL